MLGWGDHLGRVGVMAGQSGAGFLSHDGERVERPTIQGFTSRFSRPAGQPFVWPVRDNNAPQPGRWLRLPNREIYDYLHKTAHPKG